MIFVTESFLLGLERKKSSRGGRILSFLTLAVYTRKIYVTDLLNNQVCWRGSERQRPQSIVSVTGRFCAFWST